MAKKPKGPPVPYAITQMTPQDAGTGAALAADNAQAVKDEQGYQGSSFLDKAQAAWRQSGLSSLAAAALVRPDFDDDAAWSAPIEELQGYTGNEIEQLREARSRKEFDYEKAMVDYAREDAREVGQSGLPIAFAASLVAGLPEAVATGRIFSAPFAAAARTEGAMAGVQASLRANVGGNVLAVGVEDALSNRVSMEDYAMAGVFGVVGTGLEAPAIFRDAARLQKLAADSAARKVKFDQQAVDNLGSEATPQQIAAEATRLETRDLVDTLRAATGPLDESRRLLPDLDKIIADEEAAAKPLASVEADGGRALPDLSDIPGAKYMRTGRTAENTLAHLIHSPDSGLSARVRAFVGADDTVGHLREIEAGTARVVRAEGTPAHFQFAADTLDKLAAKFLPAEHRILLVPRVAGDAAGQMISVGKTHVIGIDPKRVGAPAIRTAVHEFGHALFHTYAAQAPRQTQDAMLAYWHDWKTRLDSGDAAAVNERFAGSRVERTKLAEQYAPDYLRDINELSAENFVRHIETEVNSGTNKYSLPKVALDMIKRLVQQIADLFGLAKADGLIEPDASFAQFFDDILTGRARNADGKVAQAANDLADFENAPNVAAGPDISFLDDPVAVRHGLHMLPVDTAGRRAEARAMIDLYKKAEDPRAAWNNIDQKRLDNILKHTPSLGSTGLQMLRSENPVVRMVASELLETTTGAGGRKTTASLAKYLTERKLMGNTINEVQAAYREYRNAAGGSVIEDYTGGKMWERFNRAVAAEIEARRQSGDRADVNPAVKAGADAVEAAFERLRVEQVSSKTTGWAGLPANSVGYLPHKLSPAKVRQLTVPQLEQLHTALVDQFITIDGWDMSFAANLASKYLERVRVRALGGYTSDLGRHSTGAADVVEDALQAMGMAPDEVRANMQRYMRGAAGHTKKRIDLDLLREYTNEDGSTYRMLDLFDTDVLGLVRAQSRRVSGEVALARHGIMGKAGLKLLRQAMEFGATGKRAQLNEFDAFDQVAAEFLGDPFGNYGGKWMNRAMQANSLVRLGGMGFTQAAETLNAAVHLGVGRALSMVGSFGRLRSECVKLAKGEEVDSILRSIETHGGAEFGTDAYKLVFPFENPELQYAVHGVDTANAADRLLTGGTHLQGKLSFWRAIHGAQQRGVAEQIVLKSLRYLREGGNDVALRDMGITPEVADALRAELPRIAEFDTAGRVTSLDITKAENLQAADAFVQAVHRGTSQIIQGTFIGETGKWAHEGYLKLLTQFRTFSLTSVEKQWSRNKANHGLAQAVGILMGSMAAVAPIYMARVYITSAGREDRDEYLRQRLSPMALARATLNYTAMSGLAPDFIDAMAGVAGVSTSGGRIGTGSEFVGSVVAPAAGLLDDMYKAVQNTREGTDLHGAVENLPFAKLPYLQPVINLLDTE